MNTINTLAILLLFSHSSLFCVKRKKPNRTIKASHAQSTEESLANDSIFLSARHRIEDAISKRDMHTVEQLLRSYGPRLATACHSHGCLSSLTLAHHAMFRDQSAILRSLLKSGAHSFDSKGKSLLFDAVFTGRTKCVQILLNDGHADPNVIVISRETNKLHGTPLHYNSYNLGVCIQTLASDQTLAEKMEIAQALLDHGAIVTAQDGLGRTALDILDLQPQRASANQLKKLLLPYVKQKIA